MKGKAELLRGEVNVAPSLKEVEKGASATD